MLNTFLNYIKTKPVISLLYLLVIFNILFFLLFQFSLKNILLAKLSNNPELIDIPYYQAILNNLHFAIILVIIILCLVIIFQNVIKTYFEYLSTIKDVVYYFITLNVIVQLILIFLFGTIPISDSKYYIEHADRLVSAGSYINEVGNKTAFWPIGLPALLTGLKVLFGDYIMPMKLLNILVSSFSILILYHIFKNQLSNKQMFLFLFIYTLFPNHVFSATIILTDFIFSMFFWLVIFLILMRNSSNWISIIIGFTIGVMCYFRPTALLIPVLLFLFWYKTDGLKISAKKSAFVLSFMLLVLTPWIYRNYIVFQTFVPVSTNGGLNFIMGNHANSNGGLNIEFEYNSNNQEVNESNKAYSKALNDIVDNPLNALGKIPYKLFHSYKRGDSSVTWALKSTLNRINGLLLSIIFYITNGMFYFFITISIFSYLRVKINNPTLNLLLNLVLIYFLTFIIIFFGNERFVIMIIPIHLFYFSKNFSI